MENWKEMRQGERTRLLTKWERDFSNKKDSEIKRMTFCPQNRILFNWANPTKRINIRGKKRDSNSVYIFFKKMGMIRFKKGGSMKTPIDSTTCQDNMKSFLSELDITDGLEYIGLEDREGSPIRMAICEIDGHQVIMDPTGTTRYGKLPNY